MLLNYKSQPIYQPIKQFFSSKELLTIFYKIEVDLKFLLRNSSSIVQIVYILLYNQLEQLFTNGLTPPLWLKKIAGRWIMTRPALTGSLQLLRIFGASSESKYNCKHLSVAVCILCWRRKQVVSKVLVIAE